ncbi:hypothetical protein F2Q70_00023610 [Brassica cretica]|uniref:Uncharacterized protein n=1 Tax=Brassica cretica TaxID=69181 RepID=A0A8S9GNC0_BRACR|nr:hypothetical protein F2Q70_00023610 [Brassica cretica]
MVDSEDRYSTEKASSVQSSILYDCDAEALSRSIRPRKSVSLMIKWRCCPELVQFYGFRSVEVLLDTPSESPKNCPEARGCSVRVQISLSRPVSFFMVKPRFCPSQVQSSPVKASLGFWPSLLRSTSCFSPRTLSRARMHHVFYSCVLIWLSAVFPRPRTQRVQGNPLFAGSRALRETGSWPMAEWLHDEVITGSDPKDCGLSHGDPNGDRILPRMMRRNTKSPGPRFFRSGFGYAGFSDLEDVWDDLPVSRLKYNALDDFQEVFQTTSRRSS